MIIPPLNSYLPLIEEKASWTKPWGNWFTALWTFVNNLLVSPATTATSAYQILLTDSLVLVNGDITVTLPLAATAIGKRITVKAINAGSGSRTISGNGTNIDGAATAVLRMQYESIDLATNSTGTAWNIL